MDDQEQIDRRFQMSEDAADRWCNDLKEWIHAPKVRRVIVSEHNEMLTGFASAQHWWPAPIYEQKLEVYLEELFVLPEFRRQGIGTLLVNDIRAWASNGEIEQIRLGTLVSNGAAVAFWDGFGAKSFVVEMTIDV